MKITEEIKNELLVRVGKSLFGETPVDVVVDKYVEELMTDDATLVVVVNAALEYSGLANECDVNDILMSMWLSKKDKEFALSTKKLATGYLIDFISKDEFTNDISQIAANHFIDSVKRDIIEHLKTEVFKYEG